MAELELLFKVVEWIEAFETCAPRAQFYHDLGHLAIKLKAVQHPTEPKPHAVVSDAAFNAAWSAYTSIRNHDTDTKAMRRALEAAAPYITAAKDAAIRDNEAEIERLKANASQDRIEAHSQHDKISALMRQNAMLRHPDIEAAAKRALAQHCKGFHVLTWEGTPADDREHWRAIARAILTREAG